jgi:hypothetical protein
MASILKVDEMQGVTSAGDITITSEGGAATMQLQQGLAKAWARVDSYNDAPAAIESNLAVSSISDSGTGDFTLTFSVAFADSLYSYAGMDANSVFVGTKENRLQSPTAGVTTTTFGCVVRSDSGVTVDSSKTSVVFHGDLA